MLALNDDEDKVKISKSEYQKLLQIAVDAKNSTMK